MPCTGESKIKIDFIGDIHGDHHTLRAWSSLTDADQIIQVGDFGIMPKAGYPLDPYRKYKTPVDFIEGNHDDIDYIEQMRPEDISPGLSYMRRGSAKDYGEMSFAFLGGGYSIDKARRTEGIDWFSRECPSRGEIEKFIGVGEKADVIVTHECPEQVVSHMFGIDYLTSPLARDLNRVLEFYPGFLTNRKIWVFGHHHPLKIERFPLQEIDFVCLPIFTGRKEQVWRIEV